MEVSKVRGVLMVYETTPRSDTCMIFDFDRVSNIKLALTADEDIVSKNNRWPRSIDSIVMEINAMFQTATISNLDLMWPSYVHIGQRGSLPDLHSQGSPPQCFKSPSQVKVMPQSKNSFREDLIRKHLISYLLFMASDLSTRMGLSLSTI